MRCGRLCDFFFFFVLKVNGHEQMIKNCIAGFDCSATGLKRYPECELCLIDESAIGSDVNVGGWVDTIRDHGGITFIDLRDHTGILQVVVEIGNSELSKLARGLRSECVVMFRGAIAWRPKDRIDRERPTGLLELRATALELLSRAAEPAFKPRAQDSENITEAVLLRNRSLSLRGEKTQQTLRLRHRLLHSFRNFLTDKGLIEVETPLLTKSTPEGARDFLVPSRSAPGKFYSLPQSPQLFKQILMIGGIGSYFQVARCFRDEDLKSDRQPEFTQLDLEMSFVGEEDVMDIVEKTMIGSIAELSQLGLIPAKLAQSMQTPFKRISYREAMEKYASDAPDLRFDLPIVDIGDIAKDTDVQIFKAVLNSGGVVKAINAKEASGSKADKFSKKELNELIAFAQRHGAQGMAWLALREDDKLSSPIAKFIPEKQMQLLLERMDAEEGDIIFFIADTLETSNRILNPVRRELAERLNLIDPARLDFAWVVDFPLFSFSATENRLVSNHHPFTAPAQEDQATISNISDASDVEAEKTDLLKSKARAYDLVLNGVEIGGGSIRIHSDELQQSIFKIIGIDEEHAADRFGFLLDALKCGAPPHGGLALGVDRIVMLLSGAKSLREVIAFPKLGDGSDPLTGAPDYVEAEQLQELGFDVEEDED